MSADLQDAVTLARDLAAAIWRHECPFVGALIDEHDQRILQCRCFEGSSFLSMQDGIDVRLDAARLPTNEKNDHQ